jgi:hypothetical protein
MENYITIFNSITGTYHTMPFNNEEIELVKTKTLIWNLSSKELIAGIYEGFKMNNSPIIFSMGLAYLLKSETYKLGKENDHNTFPIYLSRGNGDGFCRLCGSMFAEDVEDANYKSVPQIDYIMSIYGEKASVSKTKTGSNYTKPKKRKK